MTQLSIRMQRAHQIAAHRRRKGADGAGRPARQRRPGRVTARGLRSALVFGLVLLSACTIQVELTGHRFAAGDLAATSMGLVAHERWLGDLPEGRVAAPRPGRATTRRRGGGFEADAASNGDAGHTGVPLVTLTPDLVLAGPDSLARLIASLSGGASTAPALGPPGFRMAANTGGVPQLALAKARPTPRPAPKKPQNPSEPVWLPAPKPLAWQEPAPRPSAPRPPPARPSIITSPGWDLG